MAETARHITGIMSGTSLDGLDLAYCSFPVKNPADFRIVHASTIPYPAEWQQSLREAELATGTTLAKLHFDYAQYVARCVNDFHRDAELEAPELLAFHGHTLFHRPDLGFTFQLGSGAALAAATGIAVASDFRSANVAIGGQGAPLVPIGDRDLFPQYGACLNLGGFANISYTNNRQLIAYDICPANMALNDWVSRLQKTFDQNGEIAASGNVSDGLLKALNSLQFYREPFPRSLGREWYLECFRPVAEQAALNVSDTLATLCEHIAMQIGTAIRISGQKDVLVTGGGAHNGYLMERIRFHSKATIQVPEHSIVDFKEALVFAYLGLLRLNATPNCLQSYTGASRNLISGQIHLG